MIDFSKAEIIAHQSKSFKIGKTGMEIKERLNEPDYRLFYNHIESVYDTNSAVEASKAESYLIDKYINNPKCDNDKDGDHSMNDTMADDGDSYHVYFVWR